MKRVWIVPFLISSFSTTFAQESQRPLRVAIYHFDASNVRDNIQAELGRNIDYGKIAADLLESKLVGGRIEVINRDQIERLLKEQNLKFSDRFDPSQAPQFGKLLNVDAIVTGKIDSLYTETKQEAKGIGSVIGIGKKSTKLKATVGVTAMLIATATAKTLAAPSHEAAVDRDLGSEFGGTATGRVPGTGSAGGTGSTLTSKSASEPYIRSALRSAVEKVAQDLLEAAPQIPIYELARASAPKPRPRAGTPVVDAPISEASAKPSSVAATYQPLDDEVGTVLKVDNDSVVFTVADGARINVGDVLEVQKAESMQDPRTGKTIMVGARIGSLQVTEVRSAYSRGKFTGEGIATSHRVIATKPAAPARSKPPARTPGANKPTATKPAIPTP